MTAPRILVVDDSDTAREIYAAFLRDAGFEVLEACDGRAALERIRNEEPDLVVLDMVLPEMDGLEVLRRTREEAGTLPVVCVTAASSTAFVDGARQLGCAAFIEKPDSARRIVQVVRNALGQGEHDPPGD